MRTDKQSGMLDRGGRAGAEGGPGAAPGATELNFYKRVFDTDNRDPDILETPQLPALVLRLPQPNVLDLKMGRVTYDPEATPEKIRQETSKYPPLQQLGFQIIGMMVWAIFFGLGRGGLRKDVVKALLVKLRRLEAWFLTQKQLAFYASSILIVYNKGRVPVAGGPSTGRADGEPRTCADDHPLVELRMIDFAHVFPGTGIDQNYLFGLQKLISYLEQLLDM
nr:hypothetical protein BaRGS_028484 [Batillaria attramentaria]